MKADEDSYQAEFEDVHRRAHPALYRFVLRLTGSSEEARDIVQEAFLRLHHLRGEAPRSPAAWLYRVAGNLARDYRKWKGVRDAAVMELPAESREEGAEEVVIREENAVWVRAALASLRDRDRLLLALYQEGEPYETMAGAAGVKKSGVGKALSRAIARLEKELHRRGAHVPKTVATVRDATEEA